MKALLEIEFNDIPVEQAQKILFEILQALKASQMIQTGNFQIFTPNGIVTEKCILQDSKVIA